MDEQTMGAAETVYSEEKETEMKETRLRNELRSFRKYGIGVPANIHDDLVTYLIQHRHPGAFLEEVFSNDLLGVTIDADLSSLAAIRSIVSFIHTFAPEASGSPEAFQNWLAN